jgi:hypothetical protein
MGYSIYWGLIILCRISAGHADSRDSAVIVGNLLLASRGIVTFTILVLGNWNEFDFNSKGIALSSKNAVKDDLALKPYLNTALRAEVLYFTSAGIRFCADEAQKNRNSAKTESQTFDIKGTAQSSPTTDAGVVSPIR